MASKWLQALRPKRSSRSSSPSNGTRQDTPPHSAEPQASLTVPAPTAPKDPIRTRIWNSAYDKVKEDEPRLVEAYEKILSVQLGDDNPAPLDGASANAIKQDAGARQDQMKQLVDKGLEKTEREAKVKEKIKEGMHLIKNIKDFVALAVKSEPTAAVAWVGITTCMEIITNPVTEPGINRDGIKHVLEAVQWYWELADLLDVDGADESTTKLQELLEKHIVSLYKKLLAYQMQSVCLYNKNWAAVLVRDLVKIDDWQDKVDSIKKAEEAIRETIKQKNSEVLKSRLARIDGKLGHLRLDVQAVTSAVGGVESAVKEQTQGWLKMRYDEKDNECLKDLHIVNPQTDKNRLEKTKGGLLKDSYRWILDHDDYCRFRSDPDRRLLWIKGDPGKGKTMLLCGIINELEQESAHPLSYFFCQATQDHLRSAISVLRSLIWFLCKKQPTLMPCVREAYDMEGKKCFEDLFSLKGVLESMLRQSCLQTAVLIVDALDECSNQRQGVVEREELIDFIIELSAKFSAKWIVSSRNWPVIEGQFRPADKIAVSLELNKDSISWAVETFVRYKTDELARNKQLDNETKETVLQRLLLGANDTFLWVALVCKELARPVVKSWEILTELDQLRTGINALYERMLEHIVASRYSEICREILAIACVAYRPLSLDELRALVPELQAYGSDALRDLIGECGSFLTIQEDAIYFVHQSAQDFLVGDGKDKIFPSGTREQHRVLFRRSLEALKALRRDMYGLKSPGVLIKDITLSDPDPLSSLKYAILYWIDHLGQIQADRNTSDDEAIDEFLRKKYLYWLEALILKNFMDQGPDKIQRLRGMIRHSNVAGLGDLVNDAWRFVYSHLKIILEAPLQLYVSALVFSPSGSMIRQLFQSEEPNWLAMKPSTEQSWSACVLKLDLYEKNRERWTIISPNGRLFVRLDHSGVEIYNIGWSDITHSIRIPGLPSDTAFFNWSLTAKFAPNGEHLAVGLEKGAIQLLDTKTGRRIGKLVGHKSMINVLAFSPDGKLLASASPEVVILWDLGTSQRLQTLDCENSTSMCFSLDNQRLALGSGPSGEMEIWDIPSGECIWSIQAHDEGIHSLAFVSGEILVSSSEERTLKIWDLAKRACTQVLETVAGHSVVSLQDGSRFAYFSALRAGIYNERGACLQTIYTRENSFLPFQVPDFVFLPGAQLLARASQRILRLWDLASPSNERDDQETVRKIESLILSWDGKYLASCSSSRTVQLRDTFAGTDDLTLDVSQAKRPRSLTFSDNGQVLIAKSFHHGLLIWDTANGHCLGTYKGQRGFLSPNGQQLALESDEDTILIHDVSTGDCVQKFNTGVGVRRFLVNGNRIVLALDKYIEVWNIPQYRCIASLLMTSLKEAVSHNTKTHDYLPQQKTQLVGQSSSTIKTEYIHAVALSNDSKWIAVDDLYSIQVWDLTTKKLRHVLHVRVKSLTFFSSHELLLYHNQTLNTVEILQLKTGTFLQSIRLPSRMWQREWRLDPDDQTRLYTEFGVIDLTDSLHGPDCEIEELRSRPPHNPRYHGYGLSLDGAWILKGSTRILCLPLEYREKGNCSGLNCRGRTRGLGASISASVRGRGIG